jgi:hypothetical protein
MPPLLNNFSGNPFYGKLLALPTNNRLSWKGQPLSLITKIRKSGTKKFYHICSRCRFHKHFTRVTYGRSKISWCILITLHGCMNIVAAAAYIVGAVSYTCKIIIKSTTGVNVIKLFCPRFTNKLERLSFAKLFSTV